MPSLGSGTIFPIPESEIRVKPFEIPDHWPRCWGADTDSGAGWTAAIWMAWDRESNTYYVYDGFKRRHAEPAVHIEAIKSRGAWIPGVADAAGLAVTAHDSQQVIALWRKGGLDVSLPDKSVEAGIQEVWELLSGGRLKLFANVGFLFDEYRLYRRDDKGRVVKKDDHGMDGLRYAVKSGRGRMKTKPGAPKDPVGSIFSDPKTRRFGLDGRVMQIALMDECRRLRYCEVEDTPEPRFTLVIQGFCYIFERRRMRRMGRRSTTSWTRRRTNKVGWASRARTGLGYRTRLAERRRWATRHALPVLIVKQFGILLVALALFPFRLVAYLFGLAWRVTDGK